MAAMSTEDIMDITDAAVAIMGTMVNSAITIMDMGTITGTMMSIMMGIVDIMIDIIMMHMMGVTGDPPVAMGNAARSIATKVQRAGLTEGVKCSPCKLLPCRTTELCFHLQS